MHVWTKKKCSTCSAGLSSLKQAKRDILAHLIKQEHLSKVAKLSMFDIHTAIQVLYSTFKTLLSPLKLVDFYYYYDFKVAKGYLYQFVCLRMLAFTWMLHCGISIFLEMSIIAVFLIK